MRISDWSSDVCSSDLHLRELHILARRGNVDARRVRARRQIAHLDPGGVDRRGRLRDAQRIGLAVDAKEQLPLFYLLPVADGNLGDPPADLGRSEEHTSELQSLMRISYAVFCLK